jgi:hypothetical protein
VRRPPPALLGVVCACAHPAAAPALSPSPSAAPEVDIRSRAERTLTASLTPDAVDHQGFWLGGVLLALDDIGAVPWPSATREPER